MKFPWTKEPPTEGDTVTMRIHKGKLVPAWWDMAECGTTPYERGYDQGYLDGINLRYRAEQEKKVPA